MTPRNESADRLDRLQAHMEEARIDLIAIAPTPSMRYLLGFLRKIKRHTPAASLLFSH